VIQSFITTEWRLKLPSSVATRPTEDDVVLLESCLSRFGIVLDFFDNDSSLELLHSARIHRTF